MYSKNTTIINASGLHARPAAVFAKQAGTYEAKVTIKNVSKGGTPVDAASMISIMMLAAKPGDEVEIAAEGADEQAAVDGLIELLESGCGE